MSNATIINKHGVTFDKFILGRLSQSKFMVDDAIALFCLDETINHYKLSGVGKFIEKALDKDSITYNIDKDSFIILSKGIIYLVFPMNNTLFKVSTFYSSQNAPSIHISDGMGNSKYYRDIIPVEEMQLNMTIKSYLGRAIYKIYMENNDENKWSKN